MACIPPGGHQDPPPPPQAPLEAVAQPRQMEEPAPEGRHRWFPQIQARGHGGPRGQAPPLPAPPQRLRNPPPAAARGG